jgi:hypothetical protein
VGLAAEMFDGDPDFVGLASLPRIKHLHQGDDDNGAQDQSDGNSDKEEAFKYYH